MKDHLTRLDFDTIDWSPHSFEDPGGRLFRKDGRVFRALRGGSAAAFEQLEKSGMMDQLPEWHLVRTWRSDFTVAGFDFVVEHEALPPSPVVSEWSPEMLRDAAILFCQLTRRLAEQKLQLQDSHGWNMMFSGPALRYIDFSSLVPLETGQTWMPLVEFLNCFLHPLQLISNGAADYAFFLLGRDNWVSLDSVIPKLHRWQTRLMKRSRERQYQSWMSLAQDGGPGCALNLADILEREIEKCEVPQTTSRWSNYAGSYPNLKSGTKEDWNQKQKSVEQILSGLSGGTLLDLGCNTGWYGALAAQMGFRVIGMDTDRVCIDSLYLASKSNRWDITPVVGSIYSPMIAHGPRFYDSLQSRFQSDHTLMLALTHHLFLKQGYDIATIVRIAESVSKRTLVMEYIPSDDYWIRQWNVPHRISEYAMEHWVTELRRYFNDVEVLPSECSHESSTVQRSLMVATR